MARRDGTNFYWSTIEANVDLKNRSLPLDSKLAPSFVPVIQAYHNRLKATRTPTAVKEA